MKNQILQVSIEPLNYRLWQRALYGHIILLMTVGNKARERYQNETSCRVQKSSADKRRWPLILWRGRAIFQTTAGGVKDWVKVVLELALVLLKVSREVVGLIKDIKNLRRPKKAKR